MANTSTSTFLDLAQAAVGRMWEECSNLSDGELKMASAEDTCHFLHEETSEVVKCGMRMGLMGDKTYYRSDSARSQEWNWQRLVEEVGDVLLMAITLAESLDVNASTCLQESLNKFYARARTKAMQEAEKSCTRIIDREDRQG